MMAKPVDIELKKAFTALQQMMIETSKKIHLIDSQINVRKKIIQHNLYTQQEINLLPPGTRTYESVGRMFVLTDLEDMKSILKKREEKLSKQAAELESNKQYLEANLKESQDNIRDMVQQRKGQSE